MDLLIKVSTLLIRKIFKEDKPRLSPFYFSPTFNCLLSMICALKYYTLAGLLRVLTVLFSIHFQNRTGAWIPKTGIRISYLLSSFLGQEFKQEEMVAGIALPTWIWTTAWRKNVPTFIFLNPSVLFQSQLLAKPDMRSCSVAVDN